MHGIGNDYVYVDGAREKLADPAGVARFVSDRHFGIGSDGLILINPSDVADFEMEMYNADGSRGKMCGNGIRCVGKYVSDHHMTQKDEITVETLAGIKHLKLFKENGKVNLVRVDMGAPILQPEQIPVDVNAFGGIHTTHLEPYGDIILETEIPLKESFSMKGTCVSMGNPHCVVQVSDVAGYNVSGIGPLFEHNPLFPEGVNTEFIHVTDRRNISMRVWERGSGETWACGTGACAVAVSCILNGLTQSSVTVHLRGGDLQIEWEEEKGTVFMTGPAVTVFEGEIAL
jgi:diaminopimelate epimerase